MPTNLRWEVFTSPPIPTLGDEPAPSEEVRVWPPVSSTLIYGRDDAVLVDVPFTVDHAEALADQVELRRRRLIAIYVTHAHGDHWFGAGVLLQRFPHAQLVALPEVAEGIRLQRRPERLELWNRRFPGQIPQRLAIATALRDTPMELEGELLHPVRLGHTDTADTSCLHVPSRDLVTAGDSVYNGVHLSLRDSTLETRRNWLDALDRIAALQPLTVVAGHKRPELPDDRADIVATRDYLRSFESALAASATPLELYDEMVRRYPDWAYRGTLWASATAQAGAAPEP